MTLAQQIEVILSDCVGEVVGDTPSILVRRGRAQIAQIIASRLPLTPALPEAPREVDTIKRHDLVQQAVDYHTAWKTNENLHGGNVHALMGRIYDEWLAALSPPPQRPKMTEAEARDADGLCAGGIVPPFGPCPKCGATDTEPCGAAIPRAANGEGK